MAVDRELSDAAMLCADVGHELLQALDAAVREGGDAVPVAVVDVDHLAESMSSEFS